MTDAERAEGPASTVGNADHPASQIGTGHLGIGRAIVAPVRAVTRIFSPATGGSHSAVSSRHNSNAIVACAPYAQGVRIPGDWGYEQALATVRARKDGFVWLGLHEPGPEDLEGIAAAFHLDQFAVEDAIKGGQRPKIEQYGDMTFLVLRTARYVEHAELTETSEIVETGDLLMFIGRDFVLTVRHGDLSALGPVRTELETNPELLSLGPWSVVYAILDQIVDSYLEVAARVQEDIDSAEAQVFARHAHGRIARIYQLKRELVEFKRAVVPLQRPMHALVENRQGLLPPEVIRYFRDINDHLVRTVEQVVVGDDLLNSVLQARLAQVTVDQNNDMRKIAAWAAIAAMQTAIAGIYGMNFDYLPELHWKFGYPIILLVMFASAVALYRLFRRSGWL
jgi:magnesium transporter